MDGIKGKTAIITGANRGIGNAIANTLYESGANVVLTMKRPQNFKLPAAMKDSPRVMVLELDVTVEPEIEAVMNHVVSTFGVIDYLINNAGVDAPCAITDITSEHLDAIWDVNVKGLVMCSKYAIRIMQKSKSGVIINMSSIAGKEGTPYHTAYVSSKHAVLGITKCLARELAPDNIRVNAICPGLIDTRMLRQFFKDFALLTRTTPEEELNKMIELTPRGVLGQPQDVADLVAFVCSNKAANITGQAIGTDGGMLQH